MIVCIILFTAVYMTGLILFDMSLSEKRTAKQKKDCSTLSVINLLTAVVLTAICFAEYYG